ncbi:protein inturned isoform X1 [Nothobranchius furzeri]|uniref:Protein inturned n=1 Tax=Nothobranchius furzeri TaxID=105023 RepID=A0A1A8AZF6_NOTFU|nr:protein inturned isoform X1 [Nothobranchius furzeri]KAF7229972.1 transcript variant X1 [Nothobranchius furzeri]
MASENTRYCEENLLLRDHKKENDAQCDSGSEATSSSFSSQTDDLEPEWLDEIQKNGELFYLELSEGEEEAALARAAANLCVNTNHVRFSEKEAEIITEQNRKKPCSSRTKRESALKRLARILRRKRHQSQRRRGKDGRKDSSSPPASILKNQPGHRQGVTVQQQLKEVCVYLNPRRLAASSAPLCDSGGLLEALLGVVHRPFQSTSQGDPVGVRQEEWLTVHGLIPNSPAIKCGQILIGDVLVAVDDVEVTSENIERVLSCIPGPTQVKLTFETVAPVARDSPSDSLLVQKMKASPPVSQLVRLLWGEDTAELQMSIGHIPHIAMYLSLKLDSASLQEEEEILYQYPSSKASSQLKGVRGIFLTLCDMLENVTGGRILSSSLLLGKHLVHVGYWKEPNNLLVIGLPAERVPLLSLQTVVGDVVRTLKVMYGSLDSAFCNEDHAPRLDHFFCLFFQQLIQPTRLREGSSAPSPDVSTTLFLDGLPAMQWLTLPPEIKMEVDTVLTDFESSDFGEMSEDFFGLRRLYVILGSCLFYKSYLIANHLPKEDLLDVCLYCQHYCLLPLASEQRVGQLVIWRRVFPQQRANAEISLASGFNQPQGQRFLLIVGLRHFIQCVLLEAAGCASPALGSPGPDCVYVDQVKATLLQLEVLEPGIEERLNAPPTPCLSCADWFLPAVTARDRLDSLASSSSPILSKIAGAIKGSSSGSRGRSLFGEKSRRSSPQRSLSDSGSEGQMDAGSGSGSSPEPARKLGGRRDSLGSDGSGAIFKTPRMKHPNPFYLGTLKKTLTERETEEMYNNIKLTSGAENTLFHYVLMESVQGIFIAPTHREVAQLSGSIHPQLIRNFHHCCLSIRAALQQSLPARGSRGADRPQDAGWGLGPVKEHGVLFQCKPENWTDQKKPAPTMTYWVIGRMLLEPVPQEFYVCFHDSVPEVPVEMAFRLSFGLAL